MDFGRLDDISGVKWALPRDAKLTGEVLRSVKKPRQLEAYVGCPLWSHPKFVGSLYPKGTKSKDFLKLYATQFNSIELNSTGYRIPKPHEIEAWKEVASDGFLYCPKLSNPITGTNPLGIKQTAVDGFVANIRELHPHLGSVFLSLAPTFKPARMEDLLQFTGGWPKDIPLAVELRHAEWFEDRSILDTAFAAFREQGIGTVITDVAGRRDVLHQTLTTPSAFIRFNGHDLDPTDFKRLDDWAKRIASWQEQGLERLFFFVHTQEKHLTPQLANYFITKLNTVTGLTLPIAKIEE